MDIVETIQSKLGLLGVGASAVVAIICLVFGTVVLWALGLIVGFAFLAIGFGALYAFDKMEVLDVEHNRWMLFVPFVMFAFGFIADHVGVLSIQPLSITDVGDAPFTLLLLAAVVVLLVVDIFVSRD
jgi:uncharacterized membrane protein